MSSGGQRIRSNDPEGDARTAKAFIRSMKSGFLCSLQLPLTEDHLSSRSSCSEPSLCLRVKLSCKDLESVQCNSKRIPKR